MQHGHEAWSSMDYSAWAQAHPADLVWHFTTYNMHTQLAELSNLPLTIGTLNSLCSASSYLHIIGTLSSLSSASYVRS